MLSLTLSYGLWQLLNLCKKQIHNITTNHNCDYKSLNGMSKYSYKKTKLTMYNHWNNILFIEFELMKVLMSARIDLINMLLTWWQTSTTRRWTKDKMTFLLISPWMDTRMTIAVVIHQIHLLIKETIVVEVAIQSFYSKKEREIIVSKITLFFHL